jgi:hypothetical protein
MKARPNAFYGCVCDRSRVEGRGDGNSKVFEVGHDLNGGCLAGGGSGKGECLAEGVGGLLGRDMKDLAFVQVDGEASFMAVCA